MKLLLDTCAALWALQDSGQLSAPARRALKNPDNSVAVSVVSFWEISLKSGLGKLTLHGAEPEDFPRFVVEAGWSILPLSGEIACSSGPPSTRVFPSSRATMIFPLTRPTA